MGSAPDDARRSEVLSAYADTGDLAEVGRRVGMSRERARQIVTAAGDLAKRDGRTRHPPAFRQALAELAKREGVLPVARLSGVAVPNLRAWIGEVVGSTGRPGGAPTLEQRAARDFRIRNRLADLASSGSTSVAAQVSPPIREAK